jgi:predicted nucleotidyltransferase
MVPAPHPPQFAELLQTLTEHGVAFVLVGGGAAVLAGAWQSTDDLDIVPDLTEPNLGRLLAALEAIDAVYLDPSGRTIRPDRSRLQTFRINLLRTRLGRLDVLREIGDHLGFAELLSRSVVYDLGPARVRAADLETLIAAKEIAGREKDRAHLAVLRETLRLQRLLPPSTDEPASD